MPSPATPETFERFHDLWRRQSGWIEPDRAWLALDQGYMQAARHYHDWTHIEALLGGLDAAQEIAEFAGLSFDEVEIAIFFHDAIYDPRRQDNEARSAELFAHFAAESSGEAESIRSRVAAMIVATATHATSNDPAVSLLLDLDLAILGASPETYRTYVAAVRREYDHVPEEAWRRGRGAVLDGFLARPRLYQTVHFTDRLEVSARANLAAERQALHAPAGE